MSLPSYFRLKHKSKTINGPISRFGEDGLFEIQEFRHGVSFVGWKFTLNSTAIRKHEPIVIVKPLDKISTLLYDILCRGEYIQEVEIFWPYYNEKTNLEQIYFKHTLEKVKICSIKTLFPNVKERYYERYGHLQEIALRYDRITWEYVRGTIRFKDNWDFAFSEYSGPRDEEIDKLLSAPALTDDFYDWWESRKQQKQEMTSISLTNLRWEHTAEEKKREAASTVLLDDPIRIIANISGLADGAAVEFTFYDSKERGDKKICSVKGINQGGIAYADWTVELPENLTGEHSTHHYGVDLEVKATVRDNKSEKRIITIASDYEREKDLWEKEYGIKKTMIALTPDQFQNCGNSITLTLKPIITKNGEILKYGDQIIYETYPECFGNGLNGIDLVARVILAEICNDIPYRDNAMAVAQLILNRIGNFGRRSETAKDVVLQGRSFDCLHDNNRYFANPLKEKNNTDLLHAWTLCCFLSAQLNTQQELPKTSNIPDISNRIFMFDTKDQKIPFYIKSEGDWQRCNLSSISEAEWYDNGKNPEELKEPLDGTDRVLMIGTVAYFRK